MTAKEYMSRGYLLEQSINSKVEQVMRLRSLAQQVTPVYCTEAVSRSRNVSAREDVMARLADEERELQEQVDALLDIKRELQQTVSLIASEECRVLLEQRYLAMKSWKDICEMFELGKSRVFAIHRQALQKVQTVLETRRCVGE